MAARMVEVTLVNHTQYPIHWKDDGRPHGFWQEPWLPSNIRNLTRGQEAKFRLESGGIMTGVEGWVEFVIDIPPTNDGYPQTEILRLWFERPYAGHFNKEAKQIQSPIPIGQSSWPDLVDTTRQSLGELNEGGETLWVVIPAASFWPLTPILFMLNQAAGLHVGWRVEVYESGVSTRLPLITEPQFIGTFPISDPQVIPSFLYGITPEGNLLWYRHNGASKGLGVNIAEAWHGPSTVGNGWENFKQVFVGDGNILYGITSDGSLKWYRHDGFNNGLGLTLDGVLAAGAWANDSGKTVGTGWGNFKNVFSGGEDIIYAISNQSELLWYQHNGSRTGTPDSWNGPKIIGTGWQFKHVFSGGNGIIYGITPDGILKWYKHIGFENGEASWEGPVDVGTGWNNFSKVFSSGLHITGDPAFDGVIIYAVIENILLTQRIEGGHTANVHKPGDLLWYKHIGYQHGTMVWDGAKKVGTGWNNFEQVVSLLPGIIEFPR